MLTPHAPSARTPRDRATILCIDDEPRALEFYRDLLEPRGYRTLTVTDGLQGLGVAQSDPPDVILLDVMLGGLSGFDICRKVRADPALHDIPIILLTVLDDPGVATTGRAAGADLILRKPADPETLLDALAQVLGHPTAPTPNPEAP